MKYISFITLILLSYAFIPNHHNAGTVPGIKTNADSTDKSPRIIPVESPFTVEKILNSQVALQGTAGYSKQGRPIEAFYFPGKSDKRAMVIGGVHGSELSAIEVARTLVSQLLEEEIYYSVIVIPCLFPDNANTASMQKEQIGNMANIGRYSFGEAADPNRQMPVLGKAFDKNNPFDYAGRPIEKENQLLLELIQEFKPQRIVNLHAIRAVEQGGVYADPRTDSRGRAFEFKSDSSLAVDMAQYIESNNGQAPGNRLHTKPSALYYCDPVVAKPGQKQKRNLHGSKLPGNRGFGVSLGSWAATAVEDADNENDNRPAIRLFTMEFPGNKRPADYTGFQSRFICTERVDAYAGSIAKVFLAENYVEE